MNAGFFLFLFIILFGILPGSDSIRLHQAIMDAITTKPMFAIIGAIVFILYNIKCCSFSLKELQLPENSFLFNIQGQSAQTQFFELLLCHVSIYFPVLAYGIITVVVGFGNHHYLLATLMLLWQLLMCVAGPWLYYQQLNTTWKEPLFKIPSFTLVQEKNFLFYLFYYSIYNKKGTFIAIKVFSLLLLQFLVALNAGKASKENVCFLVLFCISAHALLPVYYVRFTEQEMVFLRNMPISLGKRLAAFVVTYAIIFIPEILFLAWNEHNVMSAALIASVYVLAITRLTLYTGLQYLPNMGIDRFTTIVLVLFFVTLMLLASLSLWLFAAIEAVVAVALFVLYYYKYEGLVKVVE